jgi:hypothetical protein
MNSLSATYRQGGGTGRRRHLRFASAGLMLTAPVLNVVVALNFNLAVSSAFMSVYGVASNVGRFPIGYAATHVIGVRRWRAMPTFDRDRLTASRRH